MANNERVDWSGCPLVEVKPEVQSGAPVLRGTRTPVDTIVDNFDYGVSVREIAEQFEISPDRIEAILAYPAKAAKNGPLKPASFPRDRPLGRFLTRRTSTLIL